MGIGGGVFDKVYGLLPNEHDSKKGSRPFKFSKENCVHMRFDWLQG